jgi:hypothetical protein
MLNFGTADLLPLMHFTLIKVMEKLKALYGWYLPLTDSLQGSSEEKENRYFILYWIVIFFGDPGMDCIKTQNESGWHE